MDEIRLKDLVEVGSVHNVMKSVGMTGKLLSDLALKIQMGNVRNGQSVALHNLAMRSSRELLRLSKHYEQGIDFVAWCTRNLFEMNLMVRFALQSEENASSFLSEILIDEKEVIEGFLMLSDNPLDESRKVLERRLADLDALAKKHNITPKKAISPSELAKKVGCVKEHKALFKFMSKYVHPSSLIVNGKLDGNEGDPYWNIFVMHAQLYAHDSNKRMSDHFGIQSA